MKNKTFFFLVIICVLSTLPFLGLTDYYSKGEPREAIVSYTMLETGNWILPINNGGDIAYKPPFFHWCIAAISAVAGKVTEYTSRMPSALALIGMVLAGFLFYAKRRGTEVAFLMALITLSNFEVHRAGFACRVDMVLTAFIVLALYQLFRWCERGRKDFPWLATLFMGCATLTKGPVGIVLPCLVTGVYLLLRGVKFYRAFFSLLLIGLISCILPAIWYVAAYHQGGDNFVALVMEENFGRFMGKMSYESHENPVYYNFIMVIAGFLPYTLLGLISLFFLKYSPLVGKPREWWNRLVNYIRQMDDTRLFSLLSIVLIFIFYCIPKSKRGVYLLPIYPFLAYFFAEFILYLIRNRSKAIKVYCAILCSLGGLLTLVFAAVRFGLVPETIFHGKHAAENISYLHALKELPLGPVGYLLVLLPLLVALFYFSRIARTKQYHSAVYCFIVMTFSIFLALDGVYQPAVLNVKSDKNMAEEVMKFVPEGPIYSYISVGMMRFFVINFYSNNRVLLFENEKPKEGYLLVGAHDAETFIPQNEKEYTFEKVYSSTKRACDIRDKVYMYRFIRKY